MKKEGLHIAIATTGLTGILYASIELASRLQKEGHRITYLCPSDVKKTVGGHGIAYLQLPKVNFHFSLENQALGKQHWYGRKNYEKGKKALKIEQFKKALGELKADKLLIDVELHELIFCAYDLKIPVTQITQWFPNLMRRKVPPFATDNIPGRGFSGGKIGILLSWIYTAYYKKKRILIDIIKKEDGRRQILEKYAEEVGFEKHYLQQSYFPPLFEYRGPKVLVTNLEQLDFPGYELPNTSYIGAMVNENRNSADQSESTATIDKLLEQRKNKKLIYCSVSTMHRADTVFINNVIQAFDGSPEWLLLVSVGGNSNPGDFKNVPENVHLFKWVPQLKVLKNADLSINHGGIHTINECIHFSVPMLIFSGEQFDQNGCAARVAYHGLGMMGDKKKDTPASIKHKIDLLLENKKYADSMSQMNKSYRETKQKTLTSLL